MNVTPPHGFVWAALLGAGTVYELHELRAKRRGTLSEVVRALVHPHTPAGRIMFLVGWGAFAAWFPAHILEDDAGRAMRELLVEEA